MSDPRISVRQRVQVTDSLEGVALYLNRLAAWLGEQGLESEADMVNESAKSLLACCWWLNRPLRAQLPPSKWAGMEPGVPYHQASDQHR